MPRKSPPAAAHAYNYDEQSLSTFRGMIREVLGADRIDALSKRQSWFRNIYPVI